VAVLMKMAYGIMYIFQLRLSKECGDIELLIYFAMNTKKGNLILSSSDNNKHDFNKLMQELYEIKWYVYLQTPSDNHKRNIEYLGRYITSIRDKVRN
jgi:hypothetical protein